MASSYYRTMGVRGARGGEEMEVGFFRTKHQDTILPRFTIHSHFIVLSYQHLDSGLPRLPNKWHEDSI